MFSQWKRYISTSKCYDRAYDLCASPELSDTKENLQAEVFILEQQLCKYTVLSDLIKCTP
jgi:hypothetical protein